MTRLLDLPLDSKEQVQDFVSQMQAAWRILLDVPSRMNVKYEKLGEQRRRGLAIESGLLTESIRGSALPMLTVRGSDADPSKIVIWTDGAGKSSAFEKATGQPSDRLVSLASRATVNWLSTAAERSSYSFFLASAFLAASSSPESTAFSA